MNLRQSLPPSRYCGREKRLLNQRVARLSTLVEGCHSILSLPITCLAFVAVMVSRLVPFIKRRRKIKGSMVSLFPMPPLLASSTTTFFDNHSCLYASQIQTTSTPASLLRHYGQPMPGAVLMDVTMDLLSGLSLTIKHISAPPSGLDGC